jgi:hypothetical protein
MNKRNREEEGRPHRPPETDYALKGYTCLYAGLNNGVARATRLARADRKKRYLRFCSIMMAANVNILYYSKTLGLKKWKNFNQASPVFLLFDFHRPVCPFHKKNSKYISSKTGLIYLLPGPGGLLASRYLENRKEVCHFAA